MNIFQNKKLLIIITSAIILVAILVVILVLYSRKASTTKKTTQSTTQTTSQADIKVLPVLVDETVASDMTKIDIDTNNNTLVHDNHSYKTGDLRSPLPDFIFSPNGEYAVGQFFMLESDASYYYVLSPTGNPVKIDENIETVGAVLDDGKIIYYIGGEIAQGYPNRSQETTLVTHEQVDAMYVGFASLDNDNLLFWGTPTQPEGLNMSKLNIKTGEITPIISDKTVMGAKLSPDKKLIATSRYINNEKSTWIYSLTENKFTVELPGYFDVSTSAWSSNGTQIAYWNNNILSVIDIPTNTTGIIRVYPSDAIEIGNQIVFTDKGVTIAIDPSK